MPVEVMAKRGELTLAYGPLKPVGLEVDGKRPFAVVQLRRDNRDGTLYNIVGFQTNLKFSEQKQTVRIMNITIGVKALQVRMKKDLLLLNYQNQTDGVFGMMEHIYQHIKYVYC